MHIDVHLGCEDTLECTVMELREVTVLGHWFLSRSRDRLSFKERSLSLSLRPVCRTNYSGLTSALIAWLIICTKVWRLLGSEKLQPDFWVAVS